VQFASLVQPSVQVLVVVLQTPFTPVHWALLVHWTQSLLGTSHTGVLSLHAAEFESEHSTQAPELEPVVRHAGAVTVGQAALAAVPWSPLHATHVPDPLQIGVRPEHCALLLHWTHVKLVVLHAGVVVPWHCVVFVLVHWTH
jgi:hypothetical protein